MKVKFADNEQNRISNCNFVKVVLMLLVCFYHSSVYWSGGWFAAPAVPSTFLALVASWLNSFHIYGFTFVSGYLFYYLKFEKNKYQDKKKFVFNKVKRLLIPFVFASIVWVVPWYIFYNGFLYVEIIKKYVFAIAPSQLWFLWMLFWIFVIAISLPERIYKTWFRMAVISVIILGLSMIGRRFIPNYFQIWTGCKYFIFFAIGMMIRKYAYCFIFKVPCIVWFILHLILFIIIQFIEGQTGFVLKVINLGATLLLNIVGAIMAFTVLNSIADKVNYKENKVIRFFKEHNFVIYLFHQQIICGTITLFNGKVSNIILLLINFGVAIIVSALISIVLHKWRTTRVLVGEKF